MELIKFKNKKKAEERELNEKMAFRTASRIRPSMKQALPPTKTSLENRA